jgi:hypothetical protein
MLGVASASTIVDSTQAPVATTLGATSAPPNVSGPGGTPSLVTGVNGYSQAAANAAIAAACPLGFTCSTANLYQIDLFINANTSGSLTVTNTGGPTTVPCINTVPTCDGSSATAVNGTSLEGNLTLNTYDPLGTDVLVDNNAVTFSVATNSISGSGAGKKNYLTIGSGNTNESGTGIITDASPDAYDSSEGALWTSAVARYSCATANCVTLDLFLSGASSIGNPQPAGVGSTNNIDSITGGTVSVDYLYSYTETQTSGTPEPATLFLMGSALVGIGLLRKRIKS